MFTYLWVAAVAAGVTALMSFVVLRLSRKFRWAPEVRARDVHTTPTPRLGGVAMYIGMLVAVVCAVSFGDIGSVFTASTPLWALFAACTIIAVIGVLDDVLDLDWMIKLSAQLGAAGLLAWQGVQIVSLPLGDTLLVGSPTVNFALTVLLMALVMNAMNFVDGLDGLVAGVALISTTVFFIYTQLLVRETGNSASVSFAALIAAIVVGAAAGFLPFNWHRAKMFMGDTGSLLIGLLMATATVSVTGQLNPALLDPKLVIASYIPIILPIAVFALPLADFTLAVFRRLRAGKSPFTADRQHLHHRLLNMGHSPVQAVLIFYLGTAVISIACLLVFTLQTFIWPSVVLVLGVLLCAAVTLLPVRRARAWLVQRKLLPYKKTSANAEPPSAEELVALPPRETDR